MTTGLSPTPVTGGLLYIHPYSHPNDYQVPAGLIGLMNEVQVPKLGRYAFELVEDEVRAARCFALDLHWFFSIDALAAITRDLKALNPAAPVIVGGITAGFYAAYLLEHYPIDYLIQGDAEEVFPRLVECIFEGRPVPDLPNLHRKNVGPPTRRFTVSASRYGRTDYLTWDWFPSFAAHTRAGHQRYAASPFWEMDHYHPFLTLNRGCRFPCNFCFGAYQSDVFGPGQVERDAESLARVLDAIDADPGLHFVNMIFGTESNQRLDAYRPVLEKHRKLGMTLMFCELPRFDQVELLLDAFERCFFDFTNPGEIPFPLRAAGWTMDQANEHLIELAHFLDGRDNCQANISFMSRAPSAFRDRLKAERFETLNVKDNYEWNLPKPNWKTLARKYRPDKTAQAEGFRRVSRSFGNFIAARALAPALYPILDHPRLSGHHPNMRLEIRHEGLTRFRERYVASYLERCVTTVDTVTARLRLLVADPPPEVAAFSCVAHPEPQGVDLGVMTIEPRFDGIRVSADVELPPAAEAGGHVLLGLQLATEASPIVDLLDVPGLPCWSIAIPPRRAGSSRLLGVRAVLSQETCRVRATLGETTLVEQRWPFTATRPESDVFALDLEGPPQETPGSIIRSVASAPFEDTRYLDLLVELLKSVEQEGRLRPWSVSMIERTSAWVCWELLHAKLGRIWLYALPAGVEHCFARGRHLSLVYRAVDGVGEEHPELRRVLRWLERVASRL